MVNREGQGQGEEWQGSHGWVGGAGRLSAAKLRLPNKLWRLMKCLIAPFKEKQPKVT